MNVLDLIELVSSGKVSRGPYGEYLKDVARAVGEEAWERFADRDCGFVDAWLAGIGVVPWDHSIQKWRLDAAIAADRPPPEAMPGPTKVGHQDLFDPEDDAAADAWAARRAQ